MSWQYPNQKRAPRWGLPLDQGPSQAPQPHLFQHFLWDIVIFFQSPGLRPFQPAIRNFVFVPRLRCPARGVSSVFVSGDAYAKPAAVLFLSLKIVVLPVARMGNGQVAGWLLSRLLDGNPLKEAVACCTQILSC